MKTQATRFARLHVIYLLLWIGLLLIPSAGQCFYNPNSGKWLSRDPAEEATGGPALYGFVANNAISKIDPLGQRTLYLAFGFDQTATQNGQAMQIITKGLIYLRRMLYKCICQSDCGTSTEWVKVVTSYDPNRNDKPRPALGFYNWPKEMPLMVSNIRHINGPGVPFLMTRAPIRVEEEGEDGSPEYIWPAAVTINLVKGVVYNMQENRNTVIAHELGHIADYVGDAPGDHSSDPGNLMYEIAGDDDRSPDCQWCQKVIGMAK